MGSTYVMHHGQLTVPTEQDARAICSAYAEADESEEVLLPERVGEVLESWLTDGLWPVEAEAATFPYTYEVPEGEETRGRWHQCFHELAEVFAPHLRGWLQLREEPNPSYLRLVFDPATKAAEFYEGVVVFPGQLSSVVEALREAGVTAEELAEEFSRTLGG